MVSTNKNVVTATANASGVTLKGVADGEADVIVKIGAQSVSYHVTVQEINVTDFEFREIPQRDVYKRQIQKSTTATRDRLC